MNESLPGDKADVERKKRRARDGEGAGASKLYDPAHALPSAHETERACLSCMMQAPDHAIAAARFLKVEDFDVPANGVLFEVIVRLFEEGKAVDVVTITQVLYDRSLMETVGGTGYVAEVGTASPNPAHVGFYAAIVREKSAQRKLVKIGWEMSNGIMTDPEGWEKYAMSCVEKTIAVTTGTGERAKIVHIKDATGEALDAFERANQNRGHVPDGYCTGFTHLDRMLWGIKKGDNVILCGRPGMGKTAGAMNILINMACGKGHYQEFYHDKDEFLRQENCRQGKLKVLMVCLESPPIKMATRAIAGLSTVSMQRMRDGLVTKGTYQCLTRAASILMDAEFYLWDAPGIAVEDMEMELKAFKARHKDLAAVCVDHCGLLRAKGLGDRATDYQRTSYISNRLMILWRQLDVIGLPLWQLSREVEKRGDKTPKLSDLRDSGTLEQDATHCIAMHRPHYYDSEEPEDEALFVLLKNRDGATNTDGIPVKWDGQLTLFSSTSDKLFSNNDGKRQGGGGEDGESDQ